MVITARASYRTAIGVALATALFLVLGSGAVGIIGSGGRPDLLYAAVLVVGMVGALVVRLRSPGMAVTLLGMAATQVLVTAVILGAGLHEEASVADIVMINAMFAGLWALSAWLFRRASEHTGVPGVVADRR